MSGWIMPTLAGLLAGTVGSMGLGGGSVLLLWFALFTQVDQMTAQGINLLFFIPCAITAVLINRRSGLIDFKRNALCAAAGAVGALAGCWLSGMIRTETLRTVFGVYMLLFGVYELVRLAIWYIAKRKRSGNNAA